MNIIMTQEAFIEWVKSGISYYSRSEWTSQLVYERLIMEFLNKHMPEIYVPSISTYPMRYKDISRYIGDIWVTNFHKIVKKYKSADNTKLYTSSLKTYTNTDISSGHSNQNSSFNRSSYTLNNTRAAQNNSSTQFCFSRDKIGVERAYNHLIETLEIIVSDFKQLRLSKEELYAIKLNLIRKLDDYILEIRKEKSFILNNTSWDKLVIGFFGETNAGKSTIIESLRIILRNNTSGNFGRDGEIVGDGRQDFTKDYHEYNLTIKNRPFVLIDVPGIEGNENLFKLRISEALRKAHIIFYVHGHNKPVDTGTAQKIKHYMSDGVKVTVLHNVRGNVEQYEFPEDRRAFMSSAIKTVLNKTDHTFLSLLGDKYNISIPVQGLLSMCAYGDFSVSRKDLKKKQTNLLSYFQEDCKGNKEDARHLIRRFSNIDEIINLVEDKSTEFKEVIYNANIIKLTGFCKRVLSDFLDMISKSSGIFDHYKEQVASFKKQNCSEVNSSVDMLSKTLKIKTDKLLEEFRRDVLESVGNQAYSDIDSRSSKLASEIEGLTKSMIYKYSKDLSSDINSRAEKLSNIPGFSTMSMSTISTNNFPFSFDTSAIRDKDSISFEDVVKSTVSTAGGATTGAAIGSFFGPIGTIVGGVIGGLGGLVSGSASCAEDQTNRALKKANELIDAKRGHIRSYVDQKTNSYRQFIEREIGNINQKAESQIQEIRLFVDCTQKAKNKLNSELKNFTYNGSYK